MNWDTFKQTSIIGKPRLKEKSLVLDIDDESGQLTTCFTDVGLRFRIGDAVDIGIIKDPIIPLEGSLEVLEDSCVYTSKNTERSQVVEIEFNPFSFKYLVDGSVIQQSGVDGHFVRKYRVPPLAYKDGGWWFSLNLKEDEGVYGHGEKWGRLNHRGTLIESWNHDSLGANAEISYKNTPFALGTEGWGLYIHTSNMVRHGAGYGVWSNRCYVTKTESPNLDLFIFAGSMAESIKNYSRLTGFSSMPPVYSLGINQSKAYYQTSDEVIAAAKEIRQRGFPADIITLDGRAWLETKKRFLFEWDKSRYPNPKAIIDQLKAMNFEVCTWLYPLVSIYNDRFDELSDKGYLIKDINTGKTYIYKWDRGPFNKVLTPLFDSGFFDFTNPEANEYWQEMHQNIFSQGVTMLMPDFGEQIPDDCIAHNGMSGKELHNLYGYLFNQSCWEATKKYVGEKGFFFTRCCWSGSQKFPSQWGGDPQSDFGGLAGSIRGSLSWGLSGGPFFGTDVGGYYKDTRSSELFVRWVQMSAFSAHFRFHGIGDREPWSYGQEAYDIVSEAADLRYRLIPYLHRAAEQACETGIPVQRAMVLATDDRLAWEFDTQFFCGDDLLVVPVINPGGKTRFYLPKLAEGQRWVRFMTNEPWEGNRAYEKTVALNELLVFVKENTEIPLAQTKIKYTMNELPKVEELWKAQVKI